MYISPNLTYDFDDKEVFYQLFEPYTKPKKLFGLFKYNSTDDKNSIFKSMSEAIEELQKLDIKNL